MRDDGYPFAEWFGDEPIDGTHGYDLPALLAVEPADPPAGFQSFWRGLRAHARATTPDPSLTPIEPIDGRPMWLVEHTGADGLRLRAWLALPASGRPRVGVVHSHGYGGRDAPAFERVPDDAAAIFPVARGLGSLNTGIGAPASAESHVVDGIDAREHYILGRCAIDLWLAASALIEVTGTLPLYFVGGSFGGGLGALAVPWDDRIVGATFEVPSFGRHDIRLALPSHGSAEAVRRHVAAHPEARRVLRWFDASSAARFLQVPTRVECALWDATVPPPGQFAVANAAAAALGDAAERAVVPAGHAEYPGRGEVTARSEEATRAHIARVLG